MYKAKNSLYNNIILCLCVLVCDAHLTVDVTTWVGVRFGKLISMVPGNFFQFEKKIAWLPTAQSAKFAIRIIAP